jgi:hypothetical protein
MQTRTVGKIARRSGVNWLVAIVRFCPRVARRVPRLCPTLHIEAAVMMITTMEEA